MRKNHFSINVISQEKIKIKTIVYMLTRSKKMTLNNATQIPSDPVTENSSQAEGKVELERAKQILEDMPDDISNIIKDILHVPKCEVSCISKLSPFVSHRIEQSLINYFNNTCSTNDFVWKRYEGKFPDIQLVSKQDDKYSGYGLEIKVVCGSCEEPSARFWHNADNFKDYESEYVVILAWNLSEITSGYPYVTNTVCINAKKLAEDRDKTIHQPPKRLVSIPKNKRGTKKNLKQTDIKVLIFQDNDEKFLDALNVMEDMGEKQHDKQKIVDVLTSQFKYREDSNAGKLNRIKNDELTAFIKTLKH
jgi:hypothetical protein